MKDITPFYERVDPSCMTEQEKEEDRIFHDKQVTIRIQVEIGFGNINSFRGLLIREAFRHQNILKIVWVETGSFFYKIFSISISGKRGNAREWSNSLEILIKRYNQSVEE